MASGRTPSSGASSRTISIARRPSSAHAARAWWYFSVAMRSAIAVGLSAFGIAASTASSIAAMAASNRDWSAPLACTRYFSRNAVEPSEVNHRATSRPSCVHALIVHPPPGTTITPMPFVDPSDGENTESVGSEMLRRNVVPAAGPRGAGYATSSGSPSIRLGGPSGHNLIVRVAPGTGTVIGSPREPLGLDRGDAVHRRAEGRLQPSTRVRTHRTGHE